MNKKRILFLSNYCLANTGFGKYQKNLLARLYKSKKYEIAELAAGISEVDFQTGQPNIDIHRVPWKVYGVLPKNQEEANRFNMGDENQKRAFAYGWFRYDEAVMDFKPDVVICHEDLWAWQPWLKHTKTYGKYIPIAFHPLDAEPLSEEFVTFLKDFKYIYTYGTWSQGIGHKANLPQVEVARLGVDNKIFKPIDGMTVKSLRNKWGIKDTDFVVLMVARNQVRKKFDALFESIEHMGKLNPELAKNIKILPFTHFKDPAGIDFEKFWKSRNVDTTKVLAPYVCNSCHKYHIADRYEGEEKGCPFCLTEKSCHTPSVVSGFTDEQLNEVYNISDLFTLATSNEGFGLPIAEALASGKIVLTTDYSTCKELADESGAGFTIPCMHYIEYGTLFYKAHITPYEIAKNINKIYNLKPQARVEMERKAREYAIKELNYDNLAAQWESRLDAIEPLKDIEWDSKPREKNQNPNAQIVPNPDMVAWICSLYKNILDADIVAETKGRPLENQGIQYWMAEIKQGRRKPEEIETYFRQIAAKELSEKPIDLRTLLDSTDTKRILYVMPQSAGDNFLSTSIISAIRQKYPKHAIYVSSRPEFADIWKNNPDIKRWLPFADIMLAYGTMESRFEKGIFDICFTPTILTQFQLPNWGHNGEDVCV